MPKERRFLFGLLLCAACTAPPPPAEERYVQDILAERARKDQFFRESSESPILPAARATFPPLMYFPPDPSYRVPARLRRFERAQVLTIPTSTGKLRRMRRAGTLEFTLKGEPLTLTAFTDVESAGAMRLFVPFRDFTNGTETYAAGRYMDLDPTPTGLYDVDFNRAYHPYCFFNETYDCPYPPAENALKIPVRAGERMGGR